MSNDYNYTKDNNSIPRIPDMPLEHRSFESSDVTGKSPTPVEDRIMKDAMQYFGSELFPRLGIEGTVTAVAPTESVDIQMKDLLSDYTFELDHSQWRHLEFESDRVTRRDLIRFRASEALTSHIYGVDVVTTVICTANVKKPVTELHTGISTYRIHLVSMKDADGDKKIERVEQLQGSAQVKREDLVELLLTPLMSGKTSVKERIQRTMQILHREREHLGEEDYRRMSSILFAFATKFLTQDDMNDLKEVFHMSILGQMIYDDGRKAGLAEGKAEGTESAQLKAIQALMDTMKWTAEQAMSALKLPEAEWNKYSGLL